MSAALPWRGFASAQSLMADVHNKATRSYNMSRIRGKDTAPELLVRRALHAAGFRYRLHAKELPGKPDIVLPKYRTVIFVHGCFWHGHAGCRYFVVPKTRTDWWLEKIGKNAANDAKAVKLLKRAGWKVLTVWECGLKPAAVEKTLAALLRRLRAMRSSAAKASSAEIPAAHNRR